MKLQTLICVRDVAASSRWNQQLLGCHSGHGGVFLLRGQIWARWLLVIWLGPHVALSALHAPFELAVHGVLFAAMVYALFRPAASAYFRGAPRETHAGHACD